MGGRSRYETPSPFDSTQAGKDRPAATTKEPIAKVRTVDSIFGQASRSTDLVVRQSADSLFQELKVTSSSALLSGLLAVKS